MRSCRRSAIIAVIAFTSIFSIIAYPRLPPRIASHWDIQGQVNGTMAKGWGVALVPLLMIGFTALLYGFMRIDPRRDQLQEMRPSFENIVLVMVVFFAYIQGLILAWNVGFRGQVGQWMLPAFSVLFFFIGQQMKDMKPNWFFGIRTPWTLEDPWVWRETHRRSAYAFQLAAAASLIGAFLPMTIGFILFFGSVIASSLYAFGLSYYVYRQKRVSSH